MNLLELRAAIDTMIAENPNTQSAPVTLVVGEDTIAVDGISIVDDASSRVVNVDYTPAA